MSQPFTRTFDMRGMGRADFLDHLRNIDDTARAAIGGPVERHYRSDGTEMTVEWVRAGPLVLTDAPQHTNTLQGLGQFDRELAKAVDEIKGKRMAKPSYVAERLKALKTSIEAESDKLLSEIEGVASNAMPNAFAKGRAFLATMHADVKGLEDELAQLTNLPLGPTQGSGTS